MRILHVIAGLAASHGGTSTAVLEMARWQTRLGHPATVAAVTDPASDAAAELILRSEVDIRWFEPAGPFFFRYARGLADFYAREGNTFDLFVLHSSYQYPVLAASRWCRANGKPYVFMPHGSLDPEVRKKHGLRNRAIDIAYHDNVIRNAAGWHFTSEQERNDCERKLWRTSFVETLGISLNQVPDDMPHGVFRAHFGVPAKGTLLLFLSRITRKKGIDILLESFAALVAEGRDVWLALCGPVEDDMRALLENACANPAVRERLKITGMLLGELKNGAFRDADYAVLPTYSENFGFAAFEALDAGLPLITTTGLNMHAQVAQSGRAMIIEPRANLLTSAMRQAVTGEWVPVTSVAETRGWLERTFSWRIRMAAILAQYDAVLETVQPARP